MRGSKWVGAGMRGCAWVCVGMSVDVCEYAWACLGVVCRCMQVCPGIHRYAQVYGSVQWCACMYVG